MSTEEAAPSETAPAEPATEEKQGSVFRVVLIIILIIAVVALVVDRWGQSRAVGLTESLEAMLDEAPVRERPSIDAVHEHIGREPDAAYDHDEVPNTKVEEYHYLSGVPWRRHTVYVYYQTQPEVRLDTVSLNQPLSSEHL